MNKTLEHRYEFREKGQPLNTLENFDFFQSHRYNRAMYRYTILRIFKEIGTIPTSLIFFLN